MGPVIAIVVIIALGWIVLAVPARRRQRAHAAMQDAVAVGDEIITAGGMHAHVREAGERELRVEIAPDIVVTLDRRAVAAVASEEEVEVEAGPADEGEAASAPGREEGELEPAPAEERGELET